MIRNLSRYLFRRPSASDDKVTDYFLRGGLTSITVRTVGLALGLLSHMLLSRALGADSYGAYAIALGWCLILVIPAKFGLDHTVVRYASVYLTENQPHRLRQLYKFSSQILLLCTGIITIVLVTLAALKPDLLGLHNFSDVGWVVLLIGSLAFVGVYSMFFRAMKKIFQSQFYEQILRSAVLILLVVAVGFAGLAMTLTTALMITAISATIALIALTLALRRSLPDSSLGNEVVLDRLNGLGKIWLQQSWPLFFIAISQQVMAQGQLILLGTYATTADAGHFAIAARLAALATFALAAVTSISGPLIAAAYERQSFAELRRIGYISARISFLFACIIGILLMIFGEYLLLLFGETFAAALLPLAILLVGGLGNAFTGAVAHFLTMTNRQNSVLGILLASTAVSLVSGVLLIPLYGAAGAAWSATIGLLVPNILMVIVVRRTLGIDATAIGLALAKYPRAKGLAPIFRWIGTQQWLRLSARRRLVAIRYPITAQVSMPFEVEYHGISYRGDIATAQDWHVYFFGGYELKESALITEVLKRFNQPLVFDIGANLGGHTFAMAKFAGQVYAFEPFGPLAERIEEHLQRNQINNVSVQRVGLGNKTASQPFYFDELASNSGTGSFLKEHTGADPIAQLPLRTGDEWASDQEFRAPVDFIKIDIEGYEAPALIGLRETLVKNEPIIMMEVTTSAYSLMTEYGGLASILPWSFQLYEIANPDYLFIVLQRHRYRLLIREDISPRQESYNVLIVPGSKFNLVQSLVGIVR